MGHSIVGTIVVAVVTVVILLMVVIILITAVLIFKKYCSNKKLYGIIDLNLILVFLYHNLLVAVKTVLKYELKKLKL